VRQQLPYPAFRYFLFSIYATNFLSLNLTSSFLPFPNNLIINRDYRETHPMQPRRPRVRLSFSQFSQSLGFSLSKENLPPNFPTKIKHERMKPMKTKQKREEGKVWDDLENQFPSEKKTRRSERRKILLMREYPSSMPSRSYVMPPSTSASPTQDAGLLDAGRTDRNGDRRSVIRERK